MKFGRSIAKVDRSSRVSSVLVRGNLRDMVFESAKDEESQLHKR